MRLSLIPVVLPGIIMLASCAGSQIKPVASMSSNPQSKKINSGTITRTKNTGVVPDNHCRYIERDLTTAWPQREYWCADKNHLAYIKYRNNIVSIKKSRGAIIRNKKSIDKLFSTGKTKNRNNANIETISHDTKVRNRIGSKNKADKKDCANHLKRNPGKNIKNNFVVFAFGREVLGPVGRRAVRHINKIDRSHNITLRGYISTREIPVITKSVEKFSVGRALSVKNQLIMLGMDRRKITILHHSNKNIGAYVEVRTDD